MDKQEDGGAFFSGEGPSFPHNQTKGKDPSNPHYGRKQRKDISGIYRVPGTVFLHISIFLLFFISTIL